MLKACHFGSLHELCMCRMCDGAASILQILLCQEHRIPPTRSRRRQGCCTVSCVCSGDEAALGRGESGGGGTATPCKVWPLKMFLTQGLTLVISREFQCHGNQDRTVVCAL